ncbi:hypothetical protein CCE01nite_10030 [Cellulomonas cellasea]|uniref:Uncharacterized protein n=1 Tax=Cellulomonas cellasea TaxID=43670 RepID=A0A4Y3KUD8_9CELL|nr:hypothetical protein CCE01nite_10030 [Cellulomonas cellasea]
MRLTTGSRLCAIGYESTGAASTSTVVAARRTVSAGRLVEVAGGVLGELSSGIECEASPAGRRRRRPAPVGRRGRVWAGDRRRWSRGVVGLGERLARRDRVVRPPAGSGHGEDPLRRGQATGLLVETLTYYRASRALFAG